MPLLQCKHSLHIDSALPKLESCAILAPLFFGIEQRMNMLRFFAKVLFQLTFVVMLTTVPAWADTVRINYVRSDGNYEGWGLHLWGDGINFQRKVTWSRPMEPTGSGPNGIYFDVELYSGAKEFGFIIHRKNEKNFDGDMTYKADLHGKEVWVMEADGRIYTKRPDTNRLAHDNKPAEPKAEETTSFGADMLAAADPKAAKKLKAKENAALRGNVPASSSPNTAEVELMKKLQDEQKKTAEQLAKLQIEKEQAIKEAEAAALAKMAVQLRQKEEENRQRLQQFMEEEHKKQLEQENKTKENLDSEPVVDSSRWPIYASVVLALLIGAGGLWWIVRKGKKDVEAGKAAVEAGTSMRNTSIARSKPNRIEEPSVFVIPEEKQEPVEQWVNSLKHDVIELGDNVKLLVSMVHAADRILLRGVLERLNVELNPCVVVLGTLIDGQIVLLGGVSPELHSKIKAVDLMNHVGVLVGSAAWGRAHTAHVVGGDPDRLPAAMEEVETWVRDQLVSN